MLKVFSKSLSIFDFYHIQTSRFKLAKQDSQHQTQTDMKYTASTCSRKTDKNTRKYGYKVIDF